MKRLWAISLALISCAALMPGPAAAGVGVRLGVSYSRFVQTGVPYSGFQDFPSFIAGGYYSFRLGRLSIQAEAYYTRMGTRLGTSAEHIDYRLDYIQVPVLVKLNVIAGPVSPFVFAGPYGSLKLGAREIIVTPDQNQTNDFSANIRTLDYGLVSGTGVEYRLAAVTIMVDARYEFGLANPFAYPGYGTVDHNRSLKFLVGIGF